MKNFKRIAIALALVVVILCVGIFASFAANDQFTGTVYRFGIYLKDLDEAETIFDLDTMLLEIDEYLFKNPINPEDEGYADLAQQFKDKKIAITTEALAQVEANEDPMQKSRYLKIAKYWFDNTPYTEEEIVGEAYIATKASIDNISITVASSLYNAIDATKFDSEVEKEIATEGVKLKRLRTFIEANEFDPENEEFQTIYANYAEMWKLYQDKMDARYLNLAKDAPLSEYGLTYAGTVWNFENGQASPSLANSSKTGPDGFARAVKNVVETETYIDHNGNEVTNSYRTLRWPAQADTGINAYYTFSYSNGSSAGIVLQFDMTTKGEMINGSLNFGDRRTTGDIEKLGGPTTATFFAVYGDGSLRHTVPETEEQIVLFENFVVPGQWTRLSLVIDPKNYKEGQLYIDYCYVATINTNLHGSDPKSLRVGNVSNKSGEFSIDNFTTQLGTWFRDNNYITNLPDDIARLDFYTEYMYRVDKKTPDRILAYNGATDIIKLYATPNTETGEFEIMDAFKDNATVVECVNLYNEFDPTGIVAEYKEYNLGKLKDLKAVLDLIPRGPEKVADRSSAIADINNFVTYNGAYLPDGEELTQILADVGKVQFEIEMDNTIKKFIASIDSFNATTSVSLLNRKLQEAADALVSIDLTLVDEPGYHTFKTAYESYLAAGEKIVSQGLAKNSRDIILYVDFLLESFPNEYDWKLEYIEGDNLSAIDIKNNENFKFIDDYVTKIRAIINNGYDERASGVENAVQRFKSLNDHYYAILQADIAEEYSTYLDIFSSTESYIEKQGVIAYLERYKLEKEIDYTNELIIPLETRFQAYKAELEYQVDGYEDLLNQNTVYFVNSVKLFGTAKTYTEKKALFDKASEYYYLMNSGDGEVAAAAAQYAALAEELKATEAASKEFIKTLDLMKLTESVDVYYAYLVDAVAYYQYVDGSIEGVAEAIEEYNTVLSAYTDKVDAANDEILESGVALGSLRANCGLSAIISVVIAKLFNF